MSAVIRIDSDVQERLQAIRKRTDGSYSDAIRFVIEEERLATTLKKHGLGTDRMARLAWLRWATAS